GGAGVSHPQPEGASFVRRPTSTVRRWAVRHTRRHRGVSRWDEPLIVTDGDVHGPLPLSFLNLLELRFLAGYRSHAPLRSIRRALDFAAAEFGEPRPLLTLKFKVQGKSRFLRFAAEGDDPYLLNASAQEQLAWPEDLDSFIEAVDYDEREQSAHRWWP